MEPSRLPEYQKLTRKLRGAGINTEMYLGEERSLGKQLQYANRQRIPVAVIIGGDEFTRDEVTIKNLRLGGAAAGQEEDGHRQGAGGMAETVAERPGDRSRAPDTSTPCGPCWTTL